MFSALLMIFLSVGHADEQPDPGIPDPGIKGTVTFFYYEDLEAAAHFYHELLQLPVTMDEDWVKVLRITATSSVGLVLQGRGFHDVADDKPAMLSMVTNDVDEWYRRLQEARVVIRSELAPLDETSDETSEEGGAPIRGFIAEDPGGYTVEFFSWKETS